LQKLQLPITASEVVLPLLPSLREGDWAKLLPIWHDVNFFALTV